MKSSKPTVTFVIDARSVRVILALKFYASLTLLHYLNTLLNKFAHVHADYA